MPPEKPLRWESQSPAKPRPARQRTDTAAMAKGCGLGAAAESLLDPVPGPGWPFRRKPEKPYRTAESLVLAHCRLIVDFQIVN